MLGRRDEPGIDMLSVVRALGIPDEFPEKVLNQAQRVSKPVSETDCVMRRDLRAVRMVTIDGEDARDLDDAVSLEEKDGRWLLGVHIADVADYVQENSALDWEAKERGTSVYLPDRVIPMLPKELSNGCCSLNAGEDRLALSCLMEVDKGGTIGNYEIVESVIRVDKRMELYAGAKNSGRRRSPLGSIPQRSADAYRDGEAFEGASAETKRARRGGF